MSNMDFIEKLLDGVQIEWQPLKEVAEIRSGWGFPNAYQGKSEGSYPFYKVSDMNIVGNETTMTAANNFIDDTVVKKLGITPAPAGTVIFPKIGAAVATNKKRLLSMPSAYDNNVMGLISSEKISARFLFYWMQTINLSSLAHDSGALPSIRKSEMEALLIPIPCPENPQKSLKIQTEIVRILDTFTELTAELTTELTARKKQYNYYRDQLLSFEEGEVEWKTLGELGEFIRGNGMQKKDFIEEGFPAIHYGQIFTRYSLFASKTFTYISNTLANKLKIAERNDLLIATTSENDEDVLKPLAWLGDKSAISGDMMLFRHNQNVKYLAYCFQTELFQKQKLKYITGAKVRRVSKDSLAKMTIPIPFPNDPKKSLAEQTRIVSILDKFDALTNSISEGLPREIELRQKQYEYYRDLLLSFPKSEKVAA
ncbi:restriction endonuclease subunit S [Saezia sanguinis]|uniref:restriction endonuclease subunit S n=1 Tax=Saezia sanguinis TaxID=1965230 RepID=UPI00306A8DA8